MPKKISDAEVFQATRKILGEQGYAKATTRLIAAEAGVNETTLYRKYGSKPKLVTLAIRDWFLVDEDIFHFTGDLEADLLRAAEQYTALFSQNGNLFAMFMSEMSHDAELRRAASGPLSMMRNFSALLARYQERGMLFGDEEPRQAVAGFLGPLIVLHMLESASKAKPAPFDLKAHVHRFLQGRTRSGL